MLCVGTNNFTKRNQSGIETAQEIIEIVKTCHNAGINDVYVSSIICRPTHQEKVNDVNRLLQSYASIHGFKFIENTNINEHHLRRDQVHLNKKGVCLLANNFLDFLNKTSIYDNFY